MFGFSGSDRRSLKVLAVSIFCVLAAACSAPGQVVDAAEEAESKLFRVPNGLAVIYVYRDKQFVGSVVLHKVTIDSDRIGMFGPGGFLVATVGPGNHDILIEASGITPHIPDFLTIDVEANGIYFLRHWIDPLGTGEDVLQTELVPAEEAKRTLIEKRFRQVKWIK